jgi:hypothetical protein
VDRGDSGLGDGGLLRNRLLLLLLLLLGCDLLLPGVRLLLLLLRLLQLGVDVLLQLAVLRVHHLQLSQVLRAELLQVGGSDGAKLSLQRVKLRQLGRQRLQSSIVQGRGGGGARGGGDGTRAAGRQPLGCTRALRTCSSRAATEGGSGRGGGGRRWPAWTGRLRGRGRGRSGGCYDGDRCGRGCRLSLALRSSSHPRLQLRCELLQLGELLHGDVGRGDGEAVGLHQQADGGRNGHQL